MTDPGIPLDLRAHVDGELEPGEAVSWLACPAPPHVTFRNTFAIVIAVFLLCVAVPGVILVVIQIVREGIASRELTIVGGFLGTLILAGIILVNQSRWGRFTPRSVYAMTDRRAIIILREMGAVTTRSISPRRLRHAVFVNAGFADGVGDVVFLDEAIPMGELWNGDPTIGWLWLLPGFYNIPNGRAVTAQLHALAASSLWAQSS